MVRNLQELGICLQKISKRLCANQQLIKLLYYTDKDPFSGADLTEAQIKANVYDKLIKVVPYVGEKETANSIISIQILNGFSNKNSEFKNITVNIEVFTPLNQWKIKDSNLRPFSILGEIQKSLSEKTIDGIGRLSGGDFSLKFLTDEISCYETSYVFLNYD